MIKTKQIAIIGAGNWAKRIHYPILRSFEDVDIVGICDTNQIRLAETAKEFEIANTYLNHIDMVEDSKPDAVYAIGQPQIMYDIWIWCLSKGIDLFIEKPLGITLHQANSLAFLANKNNCITQVSFQRRSSPMFVELKKECLKRGQIELATCNFYKNDLEPFFMASGRLMNDGIHAIDTIRWICEGEVTKIQTTIKQRAEPDIYLVSSILDFDNGAVGVINCNWASGRRKFEISMHAPGICVEAEHERKGYLYSNNDIYGVEYSSSVIAKSEKFYIYAGFQAKSREFLDCLESKQQPESNFSDAYKTMAVADNILRASTS